MDSSAFLVVGRGWLAGVAPYSGLWDDKPPAVYILAAIAGLIDRHGDGVQAFRALSIGSVVVSALTLDRIVRNHGPRGCGSRKRPPRMLSSDLSRVEPRRRPDRNLRDTRHVHRAAGRSQVSVGIETEDGSSTCSRCRPQGSGNQAQMKCLRHGGHSRQASSSTRAIRRSTMAPRRPCSSITLGRPKTTGRQRTISMDSGRSCEITTNWPPSSETNGSIGIAVDRAETHSPRAVGRSPTGSKGSSRRRG